MSFEIEKYYIIGKTRYSKEKYQTFEEAKKVYETNIWHRLDRKMIADLIEIFNTPRIHSKTKKKLALMYLIKKNIVL